MKRNLIIIIISLIATASIYAQSTQQQETVKTTDTNITRELETLKCSPMSRPQNGQVKVVSAASFKPCR